jgi:hypothetical protein
MTATESLPPPGKEPRIAEVTSFRLKQGIAAKWAVEAGRDIDCWLREQPVFVARTLIEGSDGLITDIVVWKTESDGQSASGRLLSATASSRFHAMVDLRTIDWRFATVLI